ncbi:MAG: LptF/LptG family permease, partial [Nitrospirae bacterium]|nr:LptF/LptG family permease [Nitrospirota bacterium]
RIHAAEAVYRDNQWILRSGTRWRFNGDDPIQVSRFETTPAYLPIQLTDFPKMVLRAGEMKFGDLRNYVKRLRREGYEVRRLTVDLYGKTAFPLAGGILTLIGLSFALMEPRKGGIALGIALGLALSFAYWMLFSFTLSLGYTGHLSPILAAWSANLLFIAIGTVLFLQARR